MKNLAIFLIVFSAFMLTACEKAPDEKAGSEVTESATPAPAAGEAAMEAAPESGEAAMEPAPESGEAAMEKAPDAGETAGTAEESGADMAGDAAK